MAVVQASYEPGVSVFEVARKYNVGLSTLIKWRKNAIEGSLMSVKDNSPAVPASEVKKLKKKSHNCNDCLVKNITSRASARCSGYRS